MSRYQFRNPNPSKPSGNNSSKCQSIIDSFLCVIQNNSNVANIGVVIGEGLSDPGVKNISQGYGYVLTVAGLALNMHKDLSNQNDNQDFKETKKFVIDESANALTIDLSAKAGCTMGPYGCLIGGAIGVISTLLPKEQNPAVANPEKIRMDDRGIITEDKNNQTVICLPGWYWTCTEYKLNEEDIV